MFNNQAINKRNVERQLVLLNYQPSEFNSFNPYEMLGVDKNTDDENINKAYRKISRKWHPDKHHMNNQTKEEAGIYFMRLCFSYDLIKNFKNRNSWNRIKKKYFTNRKNSPVRNYSSYSY